MIGLKFEGLDKVKVGYDKLPTLVIPEMSKMLDSAAATARAHMMMETPKHTRRLATTIGVSSPAPNVRVIEPMARNRSGKGNKYAYYVEHGTSGGMATLPNLQSIADDYGLSLFINSNFNPLVIAIARKIQISGTPANPFVGRTLLWVNEHIKENIYPFFDGLMKAFRY